MRQRQVVASDVRAGADDRAGSRGGADGQTAARTGGDMAMGSRAGGDMGMGSRAGAAGRVKPGVTGEERSGVDGQAGEGAGGQTASGAGAGGTPGDAALAAIRSQAIESWLATLPREPAVVRVGTRAAVARLEDRIAQVDDLLTSVRLEGMRPDRLTALQQERVQLVGSLAQVRYAEVVASELP